MAQANVYSAVALGRRGARARCRTSPSAAPASCSCSATARAFLGLLVGAEGSSVHCRAAWRDGAIAADRFARSPATARSRVTLHAVAGTLVLVRPDAYVAARHRGGDARGASRRALHRALSLEET